MVRIKSRRLSIRGEARSENRRGEVLGVVSYLGDLYDEGSTNRTIELRDTGENDPAMKSRHAHAMYERFDQISLVIYTTDVNE